MSNDLQEMPEAIFFMGLDRMFNWLDDRAEETYEQNQNEKDQSND
jgi:hypothetical protein